MTTFQISAPLALKAVSTCSFQLIIIPKSHTHVKKVGNTSKFLFGIYWWTWKINIYLTRCWSGPIMSKIILIFTMLHFFKKIKKNTWRYYFTSVYQKSQWYDLQFLRYTTWQTEIGNFRSFFCLSSPKSPKNQNFGKMKKFLEMSSFTSLTKIMITWCMVPEIWCTTDEWKKWYIEVGAPPKNSVMIWSLKEIDSFCFIAANDGWRKRTKIGLASCKKNLNWKNKATLNIRIKTLLISAWISFTWSLARTYLQSLVSLPVITPGHLQLLVVACSQPYFDS